MTDFWDKYEIISNDMKDVKTLIKQKLSFDKKYMEEISNQLLKSEGKMIRAGLMVLSARFGEYNREKILTLAAAIEIMHLATLIHDDIIDDAKLRRGNESVQSLFGKDTAVYVGDYLLVQCYSMLSENYNHRMKELSRVAEKICKGEIFQNRNRFNTNLSKKEYFKIISGKTAALFAISMYCGASESGLCRKKSVHFAKIGYNAGMAFQIVDDYLDYKGDTHSFGKSTLKDLEIGLYTLPIIYALQADTNNVLRTMLENEHNIIKISKLVNDLGGTKKTKNLAKKFTEKSIKLINELDNVEEKNILTNIITELALREK